MRRWTFPEPLGAVGYAWADDRAGDFAADGGTETGGRGWSLDGGWRGGGRHGRVSSGMGFICSGSGFGGGGRGVVWGGALLACDCGSGCEIFGRDECAAGGRGDGYFLAATQGTGPVTYKPLVVGFAKLHFVDARLALDQWRTSAYLASFSDDETQPVWAEATVSTDLKTRLSAATRAMRRSKSCLRQRCGGLLRGLGQDPRLLPL